MVGCHWVPALRQAQGRLSAGRTLWSWVPAGGARMTCALRVVQCFWGRCRVPRRVRRDGEGDVVRQAHHERANAARFGDLGVQRLNGVAGCGGNDGCRWVPAPRQVPAGRHRAGMTG